MRFATTVGLFSLIIPLAVIAAPTPSPQNAEIPSIYHGYTATAELKKERSEKRGDKRDANTETEAIPGGGHWGGKRGAEPDAFPGGSAWGGRHGGT